MSFTTTLSASAALRQSDEFMQAVLQTIDALSFAGTHEPDADFRAHSLGHLGRARELQGEQRRRIQATYGARPPSPNLLGTQLLAEYRGEAASVQIARESANSAGSGAHKSDAEAVVPTAVTNFSESQCRMFKKEMKQRIHEWERAVREATGQEDVLPEQKASLRAVYELYKACKNKVTTTSGGSSADLAAMNASGKLSVTRSDSHELTSTHSASANIVHGSNSGHTNMSTTTPLSSLNVSRSSLPRLSASLQSIHGAPDLGSSHALSTSVRSTSAKGASDNRSTVNSSGNSINSSHRNNNSMAVGVPSPLSTGTPASVSEMERSIIRRLPKVQLGRTAATAMSDAEIAEEKRRIKQVLHRFEVEFESVQGERPTPQHRAGLAREYHRYGELKSELTKRAAGQLGSVGADRQRSM